MKIANLDNPNETLRIFKYILIRGSSTESSEFMSPLVRNLKSFRQSEILNSEPPNYKFDFGSTVEGQLWKQFSNIYKKSFKLQMFIPPSIQQCSILEEPTLLIGDVYRRDRDTDGRTKDRQPDFNRAELS